VAPVLKYNSPVAGLQATYMHILTINDRLHGPITFVFQGISLFESLGGILSPNFGWNLSQFPLPCKLTSVAQKNRNEGLYHSKVTAGLK
jgi:hypothetical protein